MPESRVRGQRVLGAVVLAIGATTASRRTTFTRRRFRNCVASLIVFGCGGSDSGGPEQVGSVVIQPGQATLESIDATVTLAAEVRNQGGASMTGATVTWSSADNAVATVDATGKVTARANGSARIIATSSSVADTAIITVAQRAVTLTVTPVRDTIDAGDFVQLSASAVDANGHAVAGANLTWASSDTTIATVNSTGRVTGRFRGQVSITVRSGTIQGTATINVTIADFRPTTNTTISGSPVYGRLEIPAGVTVTVSSALNVRVLDSLRVSGTLTGNCVDIRILVEGPMRVLGGTVDNTCASQQVVQPPIMLLNDEAWEFDSAATVRGGPITVSNNPASAASLGAASRSAHLSAVVPSPCKGSGRHYHIGGARRAASGSPKGQDGRDALYPDRFECTGDFTIEGMSAFAYDGESGGEGTATATAGGVGGRGGRGGDILISSGTKITFRMHNNFFPGVGGAGGDAKGGPDTKPEATGGNGGAPGLLIVSAPMTTIEPGMPQLSPVTITHHFTVMNGGNAEVTAPNGADATSSSPAQPGVAGIARGGNAGEPPNDKLLIGDMFTGPVTGADRIVVKPLVHDDPVPDGGRGLVKGGKGGDGSRQHKAGGVGPAHQAIGGSGMNARYIDNRAGFVPFTPPGNGGPAVVQQTYGGTGWSDCIAGSIEEGGAGGAGGVPLMSGGAPGMGPGGMMGEVGKVLLLNASNGGTGGNGEQRGDGGSGGSVSVVLGVADSDNSFNPGQPGKPCNYTATAKATVKDDPAGHNPFLGISNIVQGVLKFLQGVGIEVTFGIKMTGTTTPGPNGTHTVTANGSGTINGRTATGTFTNGVLTTDAQGRATSLVGVFTFGAGGQLPGGQPVSYDVTLNALTQSASVIRR